MRKVKELFLDKHDVCGFIYIGVEKLTNGPLKRDAVILLIQQATPGSPKPSRKLIDDILSGMERIEKVYLKPTSNN